MAKHINPFRTDPELVLQERMKNARKVTREEVFNPRRNEQSRVAKVPPNK